ncbi:MAG: hypothetical protein WBD36_13450 [Bacteroidota bacterium]
MKLWGMFRYTVEEAIRKGTLIFYFVVSTIIILVFLFGISRSAEDAAQITMFGIPFLQGIGQNFNPVEFFLVMLQKQATSSILLFGIFGVAGIIPSTLEKGTIDLFLSKPLSRAQILLFRALGATVGVGLNIIYFVFGIWLVFGLKLGVWHWPFLCSSLLTVYAFACFYSLVVYVGLLTRSVGFSIILAFMFNLISAGLEWREQGLYRLWGNVVYHKALDVLYYVTPQLEAMLDNTSLFIGKMPVQMPNAPTEFHIMPFVYSFGSATLLYVLSVLYFKKQDF